MTDIKPCRYCGNHGAEVVWPLNANVCCVRCILCDAMGPLARQRDLERMDDCEDRAIRYWNDGIPEDER